MLATLATSTCSSMYVRKYVRKNLSVRAGKNTAANRYKYVSFREGTTIAIHIVHFRLNAIIDNYTGIKTFSITYIIDTSDLP